jgi:hypothetical protein
MKRRPSLLKKICRKLVSTKPATAAKPRKSARTVTSSLESLEGRISPAALINPTTLMFKDFDGDIVTVKLTKSVFSLSTPGGNLANANAVFKFSDGTNVVPNAVTGTVFNAATAPAEQLLHEDITAAPTSLGKNLASGTGVSITAVKTGSGNGFVDVGYIKATGLPLGAVTVAGDLGQIDAGSASVATGLASLKVKTLGARDPAETQPVTGRSLVSNITSALGSLTVSGDVTTASVLVVNGTNAQSQITSLGKIGSVTIGGSLKGRAATEAASDNTGLISSATDIGVVKIGTLPTQGIVGGGGSNAGSIQAGGKIASLTVSGAITGSTGVGSGSVHAAGTLGTVLVKGSLVGGSDDNAGSISAAGIGTVTFGGSLLGGGGVDSGVVSSTKTIGAVKVTGDIDGRPGSNSSVAGIRSLGNMGTVTIVGSLFGGGQASSGFVSSDGDMGALTVTAITGGAGQNSGTISAGGKIMTVTETAILGVTVKGDVTGGAGAGSGSIFSGIDSLRIGDLGPVKIGGKLVGGSQDNSGTISSGGKIAGVTIGPAVVPAVQQVVVKGGAGNFSGSIVSMGAMGAVKITGHVEGDAGLFSGSIWSQDRITPTGESAGTMGAVTITGHLKGGGGSDSGAIRADGKLTSSITGDLLGGGGARSGSIRAGQGSIGSGTGAITIKGAMTGAGGVESGGVIAEGKIASVLVTGAVTDGTIRAGDNIGSITVNSNVSGGSKFSARGQAIQSATADLAIGRIAINGNLSDSAILAGYDTALTAVNPDAQIGSVYVKGTWTTSDLVAGVIDGGAAGFGTVGDVKIAGADNAKIVSQIASIVIGGSITGTVGGTDHFGFVAQKIVAMKVGPTVVPFTAATGQFFEVAATSTDDVTAREVPV